MCRPPPPALVLQQSKEAVVDEAVLLLQKVGLCDSLNLDWPARSWGNDLLAWHRVKLRMKLLQFRQNSSRSIFFLHLA